jgi:hypothetical protein
MKTNVFYILKMVKNPDIGCLLDTEEKVMKSELSAI